MNRRGFLGGLTGAAVAGPGMAKGVISNAIGAQDAISREGIRFGSTDRMLTACSAVPSLDPGYVTDRVANARRLLRGDLTDDEKREKQRADLARKGALLESRIACLRAVSHARKVDMLCRAHAEHAAELERLAQEFDLIYWLKQVVK